MADTNKFDRALQRKLSYGMGNRAAVALAEALYAQSNDNHSTLEPWQVALGGRRAAPANWLAIGDSITEGQGATNNTERWIGLTLADLRARYGVSGGIGFLPPGYAAPSLATPYTSDTGSGAQGGFGLGRKSRTLTGTQTITYTVTCTSVDVMFASGGSSGTLSVSIDGGAAQTHNTASTGAILDGQIWRSGALAAGQHTVAVSASAGTVYFDGIMVYNGDENSGIRLYDSGFYGWTSQDWANVNDAYSQACWKWVNPHLVTIALGSNDYQANINPDTYKANIQGLITSINAQTTLPPAYVLIHYPERGDVSGAKYAWSDFLDKLNDLADANPYTTVLDLSTRMTSPKVSNVLGTWQNDGVHPSNRGHGLLADLITSQVVSR